MMVALAFVGVLFMGATGLTALICYTTHDKAVWSSDPIFSALGMGALLAWCVVGLGAIAWLIEFLAGTIRS